jgi:tagaturonate reductase
MKQLNRELIQGDRHPERILQIGEGNFLRCFIGWQIDILNEVKALDAGIVVARPIDTEFPPSLNTQEGLYTTLLRGYDDQGELRNEKRVISAVTREISIYREYEKFLEIARNPAIRFIVSNTTEAGIAYNEKDGFDDRPPGEYPAKLTRFLYERFCACEGALDGGFILIPCELIDYNGEELKRIVLQYIESWQLSQAFRAWVIKANTFCSTLVDRIVTGYPKADAEALTEALGYVDQFMVTGEFFHLFVIQAPEHVKAELKLAGSGLNVEVVEDLKTYKDRKVGILNGCHTALVPIAHLCGLELVKDAVSQPLLARFLTELLEKEIIPYLGMPVDYLRDYASSVVGRFKNPYIDHRLLDIALNSMTKFKTRLLPQFLQYYETNQTVAPLISLALAALIRFYKGELHDQTYPLKDDGQFLELYRELWADDAASSLSLERARTISRRVLELDTHWGVALLSQDGLLEKVAADLVSICTEGMEKTLEAYLK